MSKNTQLDMLREAAERPPYKQDVYVNAGQLLAEIEREYLPRPRFEDGEPVQFGDEFVYDKSTGQSSKVFKFGFTTIDGCTIYDSMGNCSLHPKRPEPEVLDADGVPIRNGDIVWEVDEDGHVSTRAFRVVGLNNTKNTACICPAEIGGAVSHIAADMLTHKQPDSLERIEEDAKLDVCVYFGHDQQSCEGCPVRRNPDECEAQKALDLLSRQRKVLERGHER